MIVSTWEVTSPSSTSSVWISPSVLRSSPKARIFTIWRLYCSGTSSNRSYSTPLMTYFSGMVVLSAVQPSALSASSSSQAASTSARNEATSASGPASNQRGRMSR